MVWPTMMSLFTFRSLLVSLDYLGIAGSCDRRNSQNNRHNQCCRSRRRSTMLHCSKHCRHWAVAVWQKPLIAPLETRQLCVDTPVMQFSRWSIQHILSWVFLSKLNDLGFQPFDLRSFFDADETRGLLPSGTEGPCFTARSFAAGPSRVCCLCVMYVLIAETRAVAETKMIGLPSSKECLQAGELRLGSRLDCKTFTFWRNLEWIVNYSITPLKDNQQHKNISVCVCFSGRCCHFLLHRRQVVFCCVVRSRAGITKHDWQRLWRHLLIFCHTFTLLICLDVEQ